MECCAAEKHQNPIYVRRTTPSDESHLQKTTLRLKPLTLALVCGGAMFPVQA